MDERVISAVRALAAGQAVPREDTLTSALDELGLPVTQSNDGLRLVEPLELLDAAAIRSATGTAEDMMGELAIHWSIGSTNTWMMDRAGKPGFHGGVCLAERQQAGKGRRGRQWVSPFGRNIYMSVGWDLPRATAPGGLSLAVGMVVAGVLRDAGLEAAGLKWPNDVLVGTGKLAGILVEVAPASQAAHPVVIGIGVNLRLDARDAALVDQSYSTVYDHLHVSRNELVGRLLGSLLPALEVFSTRGFGAFAPAWPEYDIYAGQQVRVHLLERTVEGRNLGIDAAGNLVLETPEGRQTWNAGEVSLRPAPAGEPPQ